MDEAARLHGEALEIDRRLGRLAEQAIHLANLGTVAAERGNSHEARRLWAEALELFERLGAEAQIKQTRANLESLPPE